MTRFLDVKTLRVACTLLFIAAVLGFLWFARKPVLAFLFAMLFAYLLEPIILRVQQVTRRGRGLAISIVYLLLLAGLVMFGMAVGPKIKDEAGKLSQSAPGLYEKVASGNIAWQVGQQRGWSWETRARVQHFLADHREQFGRFISEQSNHLGEIAANTIWIVLIPILAVFFLKDKSRFGLALQTLIPTNTGRARLRGVLNDMDEMLAHFVRAQLYLALISGVVYTVALATMRVPYAFVLGALGGLMEFIPVVGPLIAAVTIVGVAFIANYPHLILVIAFLGVWRVVQDYVVSPRILGGRVELHPLAAIFGIIAGGEIAGITGVYLAIPFMAAVRILWMRFQENRIEKPIEVIPERAA